MATVIVTGSGGLIGSEAVAHFARVGYDVIGTENDMRALKYDLETTLRAIHDFNVERWVT